MVRPSRRSLEKQQSAYPSEALRRGRVMTTSGLYGTVVARNDDETEDDEQEEAEAGADGDVESARELVLRIEERDDREEHQQRADTGINPALERLHLRQEIQPDHNRARWVCEPAPGAASDGPPPRPRMCLRGG